MTKRTVLGTANDPRKNELPRQVTVAAERALKRLNERAAAKIKFIPRASLPVGKCHESN